MKEFKSAHRFCLLMAMLAGLALFGDIAVARAQDDALPLLPGQEETLPAEEDLQQEETEPGLPNLPFQADTSDTGELTFDNQDMAFEKSPEELKEEARQEAFDAALQGLLPLRPQEIRKLLEHFDRTQESVETPVYPAPKPEMAVETLALDPGSKPVTIKVAYGFVTTLNIVDSTGAPWPIEDITWAGNFEVVEVNGEGATHFIRITPQSEFAYGNMSIHMLALKTPVIISMETSRDIVHYRFDAIIPEPGPLAEAPLIDSGLAATAGDVNMATFLEGVIPSGAVKLNVTGVDGRTTAYRHNGLVYLRTPFVLLSPSWVSSTASADGMRIYALKEAPVLLVSDKGKMERVRLSDREDILDEQ